MFANSRQFTSSHGTTVSGMVRKHYESDAEFISFHINHIKATLIHTAHMLTYMMVPLNSPGSTSLCMIIRLSAVQTFMHIYFKASSRQAARISV